MCHLQISVIHILNSTTQRTLKKFMNTAKEIISNGRAWGFCFGFEGKRAYEVQEASVHPHFMPCNVCL